MFDDSQSSRMILKIFLKSFKFEVDTVNNGLEAIEYLKVYALKNLTVGSYMDWMMPEMNGIETIQKFTRSSEIADTLAIMITSYEVKMN